MKRTLLCVLLSWSVLAADEDRFREAFADPATRTGALAELTPGTRDAFFFTALDHQLAGREAAFQETMAEWNTAATAETDPVSDAGRMVLENRQLLLDYGEDPEKSLAGLIRRLELKFDDSRPDAEAALAALPTRLDPAAISEAAFEDLVGRQHPGREFERMRGERLWRELEEVENFDEPKVRWFLENWRRPDHPAVVALVGRGLALERPVSFGSVALHRQMTSQQLALLLAVRAELLASEDFAIAYLRTLRPGAETDFDRDTAAHAAHLATCRDYAVNLPPALDSLKAHVLSHHLRLQRELGNFPLEDFLTYLALPRASHGLLLVDERRRQTVTMNLGNDYLQATGCNPVGDDTRLIEDLLHHFLAETDSAEVFVPLVEQKALTRIHARARLLAGGDPARWGPMLDPGESKELREETWIRFAPGAPDLLDKDAEVTLPVDLKNTPELLVRIFEMDLPAHLSRHGREPDVGVDLEGLVPHYERRLEFARSPWVLHRESLELPELVGAGAWLVEVVGGQVSARALIRKGRLIPFQERTAEGQVLRVFDGEGNVVKDAVAELGRETVPADETGRIFIPNAPNQLLTRGIVRAGKLAADLTVGPRQDSLALDARFLLDREQLLADIEAELHLRVRLTNHGHELPLDRIENPALTLHAVLVGDVMTERVIADGLALTPTMKVPFQVPADLLSLKLTLSGTVTPATGGDPVKLQASESYQINTDLNESRIGTVFFSPTADGHRLEVRGRNGEPLASRALRLEFESRDFRETVSVLVRTDDAGRVELGTLDGIESVTAVGDDSKRYRPEDGRLEIPEHLHVLAGEEIRVPLERPADAPLRSRISLIEKVNGEPVRDHFDKIGMKNGQVVIGGLAAGDYDFMQEKMLTKIWVSGGVANDGLLISNARIMPQHRPALPVIAEAVAADGQLRVRLLDHGGRTRVSLIGRRYDEGAWSGHQGLYPFVQPLPPVMRPGFTGNGYLTERRLSDEMRYILDRRAAASFPGSMLPRPGLLLNRWTEEDLQQGRAEGEDGTEGQPAAPRSRITDYTPTPADRGTDWGSEHVAAVVDFLGMPSVIRFELEPDEEGIVRVPLAEFEGAQFVTVAVTDADSMNLQDVPLAPNDAPLRDRRIARPFDPEMHLLATRNAAALAKGAEAAIENLLDADWRAFTTLAEAHQFLYGMTSDERLREFVFLTDWPELADERKLELLERHACHELHLFLARKDAAFFEAHVKPMLATKPEPQFIDDLLLERDLSGYLRPYSWKALNAAEKALLSQAMPEARERIGRELDLRWNLEAPSPDEETVLFSQTLGGSDLATGDSLGLARAELDRESSGVAFLGEKLRRIIIPRIDFEDTTVEEAIDFLRLRAAELDTMELDPARKGVNFVIRRPRGSPAAGHDAAAGGVLASADPGALRIPELRLRNVPLEVALKYIGDITKLRYRVDDYAVTLVPMTETGEDIFTRSFKVPPGFSQALAGDGETSQDYDPFAPAGAAPVGGLSARAPMIELLRDAGIAFPEGSSVTLSHNGTLLVTNTPSELDKIEQLTEALGVSESAGYAPPSDEFAEADPFSAPSFGDEMNVLPPLEVDSGLDAFSAVPSRGGAALRMERPVRLHLFPERTKLWRESNYYRHHGKTDESLIPLNRFWLDLAEWDGEGEFLSPHFNACHRSANEALMCLALLDLPFKAERPEITVDGSTLRVKAREPMLLFYKDTRQTAEVAEESPLLIRQFFHPLDEAMRRENDRQVENPVKGDFQPGVAYGAWMVVTNPAGVERRVDVLAQIPAGAIPLAGQPATLSETKEIRPYGVLHFHLAFYFPAAGEFPVYPLHVSESGTVLGTAPPRTLRVTTDPEPDDAASWLAVARDGTEREVIARLREQNLGAIDLTAIRWRLKNREFYEKVREILDGRLHLSASVLSFGFYHDDVASIRNYLENSGMVRQLGQWFQSTLLDVHPRVHHGWESLEFDPLINPRAHRFTGESRLSHEQARTHYHAFLDQLAWKAELSADDHLALTYFLFLQDRVEEGLARFDGINPAELPDLMQYDYLHTVVHFHRGAPEEARTIAQARLPGLPPGQWRKRFQAVEDQAEEIAALADPKPEENQAKETLAPELDLSMGSDGRLMVDHRGMETAHLRLYHVDLEVMFSKDPFLKEDPGNAGHPPILPNETRDFDLGDAGTMALELPEAFRQGNVLVAVESQTTRSLKILDSGAFEIRRQPLERTLQALDAETKRPLPESYVKVFTESLEGQVRFHKDGYTDLRGKFDYISHTGLDVAAIKRFAVLVSHPEKGARTMVYDR